MTTPAEILSELKDAIAAGKQCDELHEIKLRLKRLDPKCPERDEANQLLRDIGCYMATSTRTG